MKIVMLEEDRLKVVLDHIDLEKLQINIDNLRPESARVDVFLKKILKAVCIETGIYIEEGKVLIEAQNEEETVVIFVKKAKRDFSYRTGHNMRFLNRCDKIIFEIPVIEDFFMMLVTVNEKFLRRMSVYRYKSHLFITLPRFPVPFALREFCTRCKNGEITQAVVMEHGTLVAKGERIVAMAKELKKII